MEYVGRKVRKQFGEGGWFVGTVDAYDAANKWWRVKYEDGDEEELGRRELKAVLTPETRKPRRAAAADVGARPAVGTSQGTKGGASKPQPLVLTPAQQKQLQKLSARSLRAIKKTKHNQSNKPYTEVCEGIMRDDAMALLGEHGTVVSNTAQMHKRLLEPQEIKAWLGLPKTIDDVAFNGKVWQFINRPMVGRKSPAEFESLEVKVSKMMMTLKFRTYLKIYHGL